MISIAPMPMRSSSASSAGSPSASPATTWPTWPVSIRCLVAGNSDSRQVSPTSSTSCSDTMSTVSPSGRILITPTSSASSSHAASRPAEDSSAMSRHAREVVGELRQADSTRCRSAAAATRTPCSIRADTAAAVSRAQLGPAGRGPRERVALRVGGVEVDEHAQVVEILDALGADRGAGGRGEADQRLQQRLARAVGVRAVDQRAVELEDVGRDADDLLQAGVARAGVVERDARAAGAQRGQLGLELALGAEQLVLGELDDDADEVVRQRRHARARRAARAADVDGQERAVRAAGSRERGAQGQRLELLAEADAVRLREPLVGPRAARTRSASAPRSRRRGPWPARRTGWKNGTIRARRRSSAAISSRCSRRRARASAAHVAAGPPAAAVAWPSRARRRRCCEQLGGARSASAGCGGDARRGASGRPRDHQLGERGARALGAVLGAPRRRRPAGSARTPRRRGARPRPRRARPSAAARPAAASTRSPSAWPCASLMTLKWSRSSTTTRPAAPPRAPRAAARGSARWLSSPVSPSRLTCSRSVRAGARVVGERRHRREALDQLDLLVRRTARLRRCARRSARRPRGRWAIRGTATTVATRRDRTAAPASRRRTPAAISRNSDRSS